MVFYLPFYRLIGQFGRPAPKYAIVARTDPDVLMLLISTEIPRFAQQREALRRSYIQVDVASHPFLEYDSWVDCNDAKDEYTLESLQIAHGKNPDCYVGDVSVSALRKIVGGVDCSTKLERRKQSSISSALNRRIGELL